MERAKSTSPSSPTTTVSWSVLHHSTDQSTISSSAAYHLKYEKKQKNVSRLVATFIAPTPSAASSSLPSPFPSSDINTWPSAAMDQVIVHTTITTPPAPASSHTRLQPLPTAAPTLAATATKGPTIFYPTGAPLLKPSLHAMEYREEYYNDRSP